MTFDTWSLISVYVSVYYRSPMFCLTFSRLFFTIQKKNLSLFIVSVDYITHSCRTVCRFQIRKFLSEQKLSYYLDFYRFVMFDMFVFWGIKQRRRKTLLQWEIRKKSVLFTIGLLIIRTIFNTQDSKTKTRVAKSNTCSISLNLTWS